jgi:23S rRNA pseudouridine2605 synthase
MGLVPAIPGLFPVGRLDVTTEGLILLTNDGAFAERVSHPRYEVPRVYHAKVTGVPDEHALERLRRGVRVDADLMAVDRVRVLEADNNAWVEVTLHEGKQHEVRRLLEAVGHPVSKLRRVAFGPVTARGLEPGQFRELQPQEVEGLLRGMGARVKPGRMGARRGARSDTRRKADRPGERPSPPWQRAADAGGRRDARAANRRDTRTGEWRDTTGDQRDARGGTRRDTRTGERRDTRAGGRRNSQTGDRRKGQRPPIRRSRAR